MNFLQKGVGALGSVAGVVGALTGAGAPERGASGFQGSQSQYPPQQGPNPQNCYDHCSHDICGFLCYRH